MNARRRTSPYGACDFREKKGRGDLPRPFVQPAKTSAGIVVIVLGIVIRRRRVTTVVVIPGRPVAVIVIRRVGVGPRRISVRPVVVVAFGVADLEAVVSR